MQSLQEPAYKAADGVPTGHDASKSVQNDCAADERAISDHKVDRNTATLASLVDFTNNFDLVSPSEDVLTLENNQRLVCIGDVHGDLTAFQEVLTISGVYDETGHWVGGNTILVQCGDILDRGSEELACMVLLARLSRKAKEAGGAVIMLYGNHEALNSEANFRWATTDDKECGRFIGHVIDETLQSPNWRMQYGKVQPSRWAAFEPGGVLAQPYLSKLKVAVKVGKTVCIHAGLQPGHLDEYGSIQDMNRIAKEWILKPLKGIKFDNFGKHATSHNWPARDELPVIEIPKLFEYSATGKSPVWTKVYSAPADRPLTNPDARAMLIESLAKLDADRMVMGHVIQKKINGVADGRAWRIDVG